MAIRHGGYLASDAVGRFKGAVDYPQRARATRAGEVEGGGGLALGDIPSAVSADEGKGNAVKAWALESSQALRGGFETGAKVVAQKVDIVAGFLSHREERLIGHGDRSSEVLRET